METAQCRALIKNVKQDRKAGIPTLPPSISLLMNTIPKRKPPLKFHDLSTLGHLECSLHVYIYHKSKYPAWEAVLVLKLEFKPKGFIHLGAIKILLLLEH